MTHPGPERDKRGSRHLIAPVMLALLLLAARLDGVPALSDPVQGTIPPSLHLSAPLLYLLFAPVFTMWDGISMLSLSRLSGFLQGLAVCYVAWRLIHWWLRRRIARGAPGRPRWLQELRVLLLAAVAFLLFIFIGAIWHRPMVSLAGVRPGWSVVDFHSHSNRSHDVQGTLMRGFDREANRRWHARAGFDAAFLTDHNVVSRESGVRSGESRVTTGGHAGAATVICPGTEVSAWHAHIVLLGDTIAIPRNLYAKDLDGLLILLQRSDSAYHALSLASLPEYRRSHWDQLDKLVVAGLDGFEIVNASPAANELTRSQRDTVVARARAQNRFVVGVSDSHGWGATSMVWNLVLVSPETPDLCTAILGQLQSGFPAVRIVERHRLRPDDWCPSWLTPVGVVWETWRSMGWPLTIAWLGWIALYIGWRLRPPLLRTHSETKIVPD
jgi:hypothetical protein